MEQIPIVIPGLNDVQGLHSGSLSVAQGIEINEFGVFIAEFSSIAAEIDVAGRPHSDTPLARDGPDEHGGDVLPPVRPALAFLLPAALGAIRPPTEVVAVDHTNSTRGAHSTSLSSIDRANKEMAGKRLGASRSSGLNIIVPLTEPGSGRDREDLVEIKTGGENGRVATTYHTSSDPTSPASLHKPLDFLSTMNGTTAKLPSLPLEQPAVFAERLSQSISVMLTHNAQHARIAVTPPELGPVDVHVTVTGEEATVRLISPLAATREALEDALPRLRILFADSGLSLGHAGVFAETPGRGHTVPADGDDDPMSGTTGAASLDDARGRIRMKLGLIDQFV